MTKRIVRPRLHVLRIMVFSFEAELYDCSKGHLT